MPEQVQHDETNAIPRCLRRGGLLIKSLVIPMKRSLPHLFLILCLYTAVCGYRIDALPGEWYGDISIEHEYITRILSGNYSFAFDLSAGPVYHFFIAPLIALLGQSYLSYKIASIMTGGIGIVLLFNYGKALVGPFGGNIAAALAAVSFWYISFCRLGSSPQILTPLLGIGLLYSLYAYHQKQKLRYLMLGACIAFFGLFTYPATFHLPSILFLYVAGETLSQWKKTKRLRLTPIVSAGIGVIVSYAIFFLAASKQDNLFTSGYIGEKLFFQTQTQLPAAAQWLDHFFRTILMFWGTGDVTFRINVPHSPHLDPVSGILFALGLGIMVVKKDWRFWYIGAPVFLLVLPSTLPGIPASEVPSMSRCLAVTPFVFLSIAYGIKWAFAMVHGKRFRWFCSASILGIICMLNLTKYFVEYPKSLPDGNKPFGKIIASYINTLPPTVDIKLTGCCWGAWGQAEPKSVYYQLAFQKGSAGIVHDTFLSTCTSVNRQNDTLIIMPPHDSRMHNIMRQCFPDAKEMHHAEGAMPIFTSLFIPRTRGVP